MSESLCHGLSPRKGKGGEGGKKSSRVCPRRGLLKEGGSTVSIEKRRKKVGNLAAFERLGKSPGSPRFLGEKKKKKGTSQSGFFFSIVTIN